MPRRARSAPKTGLIIGSIVACLIIVATGAFFLGGTGAPYRTSPEFPVEEYLTASSSLRGNSYRLSGAVLNSIAWSPESGRLISIEPEGAKSPIPIVIPADLAQFNIQKGQRFHFLVDVRESGIVFARDLTKP